MKLMQKKMFEMKLKFDKNIRDKKVTFAKKKITFLSPYIYKIATL